MKLSLRDLRRGLARGGPDRPAYLLYGGDPMRVALVRAELVQALVGAGAAEEMRLDRLAAADIRRDPATLADALAARGFFPGPRAVIVEDATDAVAAAVEAAIGAQAEGDATLVVAAGALAARGALRKLFEVHPAAAAIPLYDDPPDRDEIARLLAHAGLDADAEAMAGITALAATLDPGDLAQTIERLAVYKLGDETPLDAEELSRLAPRAGEAETDALVDAVAAGRGAEVPVLLGRLVAQGAQPVALAIATLRHFRLLHQAASHPGGAAAGIQALRPPVYGPRRTHLQRAAEGWGSPRLERALRLLVETDLALRSSARAPARPMLERALIRVALLAPR